MAPFPARAALGKVGCQLLWHFFFGRRRILFILSLAHVFHVVLLGRHRKRRVLRPATTERYLPDEFTMKETLVSRLRPHRMAGGEMGLLSGDKSESLLSSSSDADTNYSLFGEQVREETLCTLGPC